MKKSLPFLFVFVFPFLSFSQDNNVADTAAAAPDTTNLLPALGADNIPMVSLSDDDLKESSTRQVSSMLYSSRDIFASAAAYSFSVARFRVRGYESDHVSLLVNGAPMTDLATGRSQYSSWSGLNDMFRAQEATYGLAAANYSFGDIGGTHSYDVRASRQRKQLSVSYAISNRSYENRLMVSYGSGLKKGGWSYALSYTRRWAQEGYIDGTFYDGHSYFASIEKLIGSHSISLSGFGAPTKSGRSSTATQEMYDLSGSHYYNSNWGYQEGKKRNAVVGDGHVPVIILSDQWKIDTKSSLETSVSYSFGKYKVSGFDWYNAVDPRPDYYRKLPSFDPYYGDDPESYAKLSAEITELYKNNEDIRQINWKQIYADNAIHDTTFNGTTGKWAKYILHNRVVDTKRFAFNSFYNNTLTDHIKLSAGLSYQKQSTEYYEEVTDLLGADFYVDLNQFADQANPMDGNAMQNDLNNPNRILYKGDKYGYDYFAHISDYGIWAQSVFNYNRFDYMLAVQYSLTSMYRSSDIKNGIFPDNSEGDSPTHDFSNYGVKGGATFKLDGRNYFFANASYQSLAPYFNEIFLSPRSRHAIIENPENENLASIEGGYNLKAPRFKGKLAGYLTQSKNETETRTFYHDDYHTLVNYTLTGVNKRYVGIEAAVEASLGKGFSATAVAAIGQYFYNSRPLGTATQDNKDTILAKDVTIYWDNIRLGGSPQQAYSFGLSYRSKRYWNVNATVNFFDGLYYNPNPSRRTLNGLDLVDQGTDKWNSILSQPKAPDSYTVDFYGGWSWMVNRKFKELKKRTYLALSLGVSNITDNTDIVTTAYEQLRYDSQDHNINKFPPKFGYAFGRTFFANVALRFN